MVTNDAEYVWISLNIPLQCLIMLGYFLIVLNALNIPKHTWINRVLNMPKFWMCLIQYIASGHCTNYWAVIETDAYSEHCQSFKIERFARRILLEYRCTTKLFQARAGFVELGQFIKHFVKSTSKKLHSHKTTFWIKTLTQQFYLNMPEFNLVPWSILEK